MNIKVTNPTPTEAVITIEPTLDELTAIKKHVLKHFQDQVKVAGFRAGKTPVELVEKNADQHALQARFLDEAIEQLYRQALQSRELRPVDRPQITLKKFVPFTTLEFEATVAILGKIKLGNYKNISLPKPQVSITAKDVNEVLESLQTRMAEKKDVDRASKDGDQVWIDFTGTDTKGQPVNGADGKDYPLLLGSKTFIPGFEENLLGLKANNEKTFTLTFPKDYGVKALAGSKVTFKVVVTKVQEVVKPKLDDEFAKKAGPFTSLATLKDDIKKQITVERQNQATGEYESALIQKITAGSQVDVPKPLVDEQLERIIASEKQNVLYRGKTWEEHLKNEKTDETGLKENLRPMAEERVKASLVLSEIADVENVTLTKEELDERMQMLRSQYKDPQMQAELAKDEARQDIASRMLTEKTIQIITGYAKK